MRQCAGTKAETIGRGELGVRGAVLGFPGDGLQLRRVHRMGHVEN
jgi:hypothetical protein